MTLTLPGLLSSSLLAPPSVDLIFSSKPSPVTSSKSVTHGNAPLTKTWEGGTGASQAQEPRKRSTKNPLCRELGLPPPFPVQIPRYVQVPGTLGN